MGVLACADFSVCHNDAHSKEKFDGESFILKCTRPDNFPTTNSGWYMNGFQLFTYAVNTECLLGKVKRGMEILRAKGCFGSFLALCASC